MLHNGLLRQKNFYPLFWTQFLGAFNDNFLKNALVIIVTLKSLTVFGFPAEQTVAIAGGVFILPFFLFSAIAGQISDKFDKSRVLQAAKLLEILIMLFSAWALLLENYEFLLITLFFMGLQSTFFGPAKFSILPQHLRLEKLVAGNALIEAGTFLAILLGTIFGGLMVAQTSGPLYVSMGLIFISIVGFITSLGIPRAPSGDPQLQLQWNPLSTTWKMIALAAKNRPVFLTILGASWFWFVGAMILSILPPLCTKVLAADENMITLFLTVFSIGIGLGSILCERFSQEEIELALVPIGAIGVSVFSFFLYAVLHQYVPTTQSLWDFATSGTGFFILFSLFGLSLLSGMYIVPLNALMQARADLQTRSRMISANNIINSLAMVIASVVLLVLLKMGMQLAKVFLLLALANGLVVGCLFYFMPEFLQRLKKLKR